MTAKEQVEEEVSVSDLLIANKRITEIEKVDPYSFEKFQAMIELG